MVPTWTARQPPSRSHEVPPAATLRPVGGEAQGSRVAGYLVCLVLLVPFSVLAWFFGGYLFGLLLR